MRTARHTSSILYELILLLWHDSLGPLRKRLHMLTDLSLKKRKGFRVKGVRPCICANCSFRNHTQTLIQAHSTGHPF